MSSGYPVIGQGLIDVGDPVVPVDLSFNEPGVRKYHPDIDKSENIIGCRIQSSKVLKSNYILICFNNNYSCLGLEENFEELTV